jgi:hypothetical protein
VYLSAADNSAGHVWSRPRDINRTVLPSHLRFPRPGAVCLARKVGLCASKIGRLASKRHKWHLERASGNALQAWTKGSYDTIPTLSSGLSAPKNPALSQRLAVIVTKVGRQEQQKPCLAPILAPKLFVSASVFAAKLCGKLCDPRPWFLATPSRPAGDVQRRRQARDALQPFYCTELAAYRLKDLSGPHGRPTFVATAANLPGKAQAGRLPCPEAHLGPLSLMTIMLTRRLHLCSAKTPFASRWWTAPCLPATIVQR